MNAPQSTVSATKSAAASTSAAASAMPAPPVAAKRTAARLQTMAAPSAPFTYRPAKRVKRLLTVDSAAMVSVALAKRAKLISDSENEMPPAAGEPDDDDDGSNANAVKVTTAPMEAEPMKCEACGSTGATEQQTKEAAAGEDDASDSSEVSRFSQGINEIFVDKRQCEEDQVCPGAYIVFVLHI